MPAIWVILGLIGIYLVLIVGPSVTGFFLIFCKRWGSSYMDRKLEGTTVNDYIPELRESFAGMEARETKDVSIVSFDGLCLHGDYYDSGSSKTAILFHGYNAYPLNNFSFIGNDLLERGFNVLMIHQRAHNRSEGKHCTMGLLEAEDTVSWVEYVSSNPSIEAIVCYGISMGATALGYASSKIKSPKVKGLIIDCGFTSPAGQFKESDDKRHLPGFLLVPVTGLCVNLFLHLDIYKSTLDSLEKSTIPKLFVHGRLDETVPVTESAIAFEKAAEPKKIVISERGFHAISYMMDKDIPEAVWEFIEEVV